MPQKEQVLYGFSPDLPPFVDKTPANQAALLQSWGVTAVFGGYQSPDFVTAIHRAGMKIYAEFACFVGEQWWQTVPASRPITADGLPLAKSKWYCGVNPATAQVRQAQLAAFERLLADYPLDGVWLDFIRWPCHWEGRDPDRPQTSFDPDTLAQFSRDTGIALPEGDVVTLAQTVLTRYGAAWTAWRCEQVTAWVAEARNILQRLRPEAILGLFGVPWRLEDYDGAIWRIVGQDYRRLAPHVDLFSPMVYHKLCGRSIGWIGRVTEEVQALSHKPVWPIIQSVDVPTPLSAAEYGQALDAALQTPASEGVIVFTLKGMLDEAKLSITRAKFQGRVSGQN